ncbi:carbohydrate kinase family protein [Pelagicoccus albus]|uniref:Carbohydrate kinase n=1 Tax=Pelagicoccus albus TaxID=415222 RepID=A0A7X1B438_9BACT|nr:carbohydrate kinase [Pelagicoccus albus]MBC2605192.1 carbohydrate kinase [Pelagicoccus albus]
MSESKPKRLVAFGEVLWDCLPRGIFLGGAPLNLAYHAARLGAESFVASSVGRDFLGDETVKRVQAAGIDARLLKRHPRLQTGAAVAKLSGSGDASYDILRPVAWDEISLDPEDFQIAEEADAFVFGSLSARSASNRDLLNELLAKTEAVKICDVNLRSPYDDKALALELAKRADVIKVNDEELGTLSGVSGELLPGIEALHEATGCGLICVTRGAEGAAVWRDGEFISRPTEKVEVADTIGAGDSFTAALGLGLLEDLALEDSLNRALKLSAFVATKDGAQPDYNPAELFA